MRREKQKEKGGKMVEMRVRYRRGKEAAEKEIAMLRRAKKDRVKERRCRREEKKGSGGKRRAKEVEEEGEVKELDFLEKGRQEKWRDVLTLYRSSF